MSWFTQSKAFVRSQNILPTVWLLFIAFNIQFIRVKAACSVEWSGLNPNCPLDKMLFTYMYLNFLNCILCTVHESLLQALWRDFVWFHFPVNITVNIIICCRQNKNFKLTKCTIQIQHTNVTFMWQVLSLVYIKTELTVLKLS